jgi:hypothetical protein
VAWTRIEVETAFLSTRHLASLLPGCYPPMQHTGVLFHQKSPTRPCASLLCYVQQPKPLQPQRSGGNLQQLKAAAAAATSGVLASGLQCLQAFQGFKPLGRALVGSPTQSGSASPAALTYQSLCQASAPDLCSHLRRAQGRGDSLLDVLFPANGGGSGTASPGGLVQRSASSAVVGGRVYHRWVLPGTMAKKCRHWLSGVCSEHPTHLPCAQQAICRSRCQSVMHPARLAHNWPYNTILSLCRVSCRFKC